VITPAEGEVYPQVYRRNGKDEIVNRTKRNTDGVRLENKYQKEGTGNDGF